MYEENNLESIIAHYGFDPYVAIEKHINEEIIPKFDCLISCHRSNHDEEGNPAIQFYSIFAKNQIFQMRLWNQCICVLILQVSIICDLLKRLGH